MFYKIYVKIRNFIVENIKFILSIIVLILLFEIELPYVIYKPGGSINLNKRVEVERGYLSEGTLEMAYVSLVKGSIPFLGLAYVLPDWDIAPKEEVAMDDESIQEVLEKDKIYLQEAINNATMVAFKAADKKIKITNIINNVIYITEEAETTLQDYDQILSVENIKISSLDDLKKIVNQKEAGDIINIKIRRDGKENTATAKVYSTDDGLKIGVSIVNTYEYETDPEVEVKTKSSESGPSGGLMTSLSIYNALVREDITKGRKIVGTGTITRDGIVGEIGGVKYKLMGAVKNKADIFICPKANYNEAINVAKEKNYDIKIISVGTFDDALNYLINS